MSFLQQGGSSLFYNPFKQNHDFQGSRASIFQCFFLSFSAFHSGPHFSGFFGDFRVAKPPVLESIPPPSSDIKKKSRKRVCGCLRPDATGCEYRRGGIPLNKITIPAETAFQHQYTPAVPEGTVADYQNDGLEGFDLNGGRRHCPFCLFAVGRCPFSHVALRIYSPNLASDFNRACRYQ